MTSPEVERADLNHARIASASGSGGARILVCGFSGHRRPCCAECPRLSYRPNVYVPWLCVLRQRNKKPDVLVTPGFLRACRPPLRSSVTSAIDARSYYPRACIAATGNNPRIFVLGLDLVVSVSWEYPHSLGRHLSQHHGARNRRPHLTLLDAAGCRLVHRISNSSGF